MFLLFSCARIPTSARSLVWRKDVAGAYTEQAGAACEGTVDRYDHFGFDVHGRQQQRGVEQREKDQAASDQIKEKFLCPLARGFLRLFDS